MEKKIYVILGQKRAGKDFVGGILADYLECETYAFAEDMKVILSETFGINIDEFNKLKNEDMSLYITELDYLGVNYNRLTSFRKVIQNFGQSIKKLYGDAFWADRLIQKIKYSAETIIITDLRYNIELYQLQKHFDVTTIKVINSNLENDDLHSSEQEMRYYKADIVLDNTNHILKEGNVLEKVLL